MATFNGVGAVFARRFLIALRYRDYRILWATYLCAQSADWALIVARGALALTLTDSAFWPALVTYAAMIPSVIVSPFAGYLADRFDRRTVMTWTYALNTGHNVLLAFLVVTGTVQPWHLVALAVLNGSIRATKMPAAHALMANTLPPEKVFNGVALFQASMHGARFVGPLLILINLWATGRDEWAFFVAAGLYAVGFVLSLNIRTSARGEVVAGTGMEVIIRNMGAGLGFIYRYPLALALIVLVIAHCALTMSFESLFPVFSRDALHMEHGAGFMAGFGYMMVAFGAAAFVATVSLAGVRSEEWRGRLFLITGVASGLSPLALGLSSNLGMAMLAVAGMGASQAGFMAISHGVLQTISPDAVRGRVMGVYNWHILGFMATFNLVNGTLVQVTPLTASMILGGGGVIFVVITIISLGWLSMRRIYEGRYLEKAARP